MATEEYRIVVIQTVDFMGIHREEVGLNESVPSASDAWAFYADIKRRPMPGMRIDSAEMSGKVLTVRVTMLPLHPGTWLQILRSKMRGQ